MSIQTTAAFRERQNASLERSKRTAAALDQAIKEDLAEIVNDASGDEVTIVEALNRIEAEE
jgi:predicted component of type VI protein secretion system